MLCILIRIVPADFCLAGMSLTPQTCICIFDPDTAHRLAGWGRDWHENHRLGQAEFKVRSLQYQCFSRKSPKLGEGGGADLTVFCRLRRMSWTASSQA